MTEEFKKENFREEEFELTWFVWKPLTKKECEGMPEWEELGGAFTKPKTEKDWKNAVLCITRENGHEIDCEIDEYTEWHETGMSLSLINFLRNNNYWIDIKVEKDEIKPLTVSKMGRKKIVNIPNKNKTINAGDKIRVTKVKD